MLKLRDAEQAPCSANSFLWAFSPFSNWDVFSDPSHSRSTGDVCAGVAVVLVLNTHSTCSQLGAKDRGKYGKIMCMGSAMTVCSFGMRDNSP